MAILYFVLTLTIPWFHLQFAKAQLRKRGQTFGWNTETFEAMYIGAISSICISVFTLLAEVFGMEVGIGPVGYLFAIICAFLVYEFYIQKSE